MVPVVVEVVVLAGVSEGGGGRRIRCSVILNCMASSRDPVSKTKPTNQPTKAEIRICCSGGLLSPACPISRFGKDHSTAVRPKSADGDNRP